MNSDYAILLAGITPLEGADLKIALNELGVEVQLTQESCVEQAFEHTRAVNFDVCVIPDDFLAAYHLYKISEDNNNDAAPTLILVKTANVANGGNSILSNAGINAEIVDVIPKEFLSSQLLARSIKTAILTRNSQALKNEMSTIRKEKKFQHNNSVMFTETFVRVLAHDIRTPLSVISQSASILGAGLLGELNSDQSEYAETIVERAKGLNVFLNNLLDVSKLENSSLSLFRKRVSAGTLLEALESNLENANFTDSISCNTSAFENLSDGYFDVDTVTRAMLAFCQFTSKLMKAGDVLSINAKMRPDDSYIDFEISSTGRGLPHERIDELNAILSSGQRDTESMSAKFGLSLCIAKEFFRINFCDISVRNNQNGGCGFLIALPVFSTQTYFRKYAERIIHFDRSITHISIVECKFHVHTETERLGEFTAGLHNHIRSTDLVLSVSPTTQIIVLATSQDSCEAFLSRIKCTIDDENSELGGASAPKPELTSLGSWRLSEQLDGFLNKMLSYDKVSKAGSQHSEPRLESPKRARS